MSESHGPRNGESREDYYRGLLAEQEEGGGSLRAFAAERGLSAWTLYGWRRKLGRSRRRRRGAGGLVAVELVEGVPAMEQVESRFEVVLADGCRVRVPADFEAARLAELIGVLRSC